MFGRDRKDRCAGGFSPMKKVAIMLALLTCAADASAQERHDIAGMDCAAVQALLKEEGSAILRYRSATNLSLPLYDLYVSGQKQCPAGEVAARKGVPTTDREYCPVYRCVESDIFVAR
jgi:hypothetical protein